MKPQFLLFPAVLGGALLLSPAAHAHFLWAQTDAQNSQLSLYFGEGGEGVTTDVKPELIAKATAWKPSGQALSPVLKGGAFRAAVDGQTPVFGARQSWGVLDRSEEGRGVFRLEYFAKAAVNLDKAGFSAKLPLELFARREGQNALVSLRLNGAPVAGADVTVVSPDNQKGAPFQTDAQGQIRFPVAVPGLYALRAVSVNRRAGELGGKKYSQTRNWTTLTFHNENAAPATLTAVAATEKPLGHPKADPRAYRLLEAASSNRQVMPADFVGFEASLHYRDGEATKTGKVVFRKAGETQISLEGLNEDDYAWLEDKLLNLIGHRRGGDFAQGDGRHPLSLVEGDVNSFGQLIRLNDRMNSQYRVKDNQVTEVTRTAGGVKFTITVLDSMTTDAGKYLANHFMVSYRDEKTASLQKVEGYRDSYAQIDGVWLPTSRVVYDVTPESVTPRVRSLRLRDIKVFQPAQITKN